MSAVLAGFAVSPFLRAVYGLFTDPPVRRDEFTLAMVIVSLLAGFLAYLIGGYVAAKQARVSGGVNGAMTAVFGLVIGLILSILLILLLFVTGGQDYPPGPVGLGATSGGGFISVLILFLVNLAGGYLGGRLAESRGR